MHYTAHPERDALAHDDEQERLGEIAEAAMAREHKQLSDAFVDAAEWGADEPLKGSTVVAGDALYEAQCHHKEGSSRVEALVYWAARQKDNAVLRAMVREIADAFADVRTRP